MGKPDIRDNTPAEERDIQRQIAEDPDTLPTAPGAQVVRRGRPAGATKEHVSLRLDLDVLAALKTPQEKGWQTRLNLVLRQGLNLGSGEAASGKTQVRKDADPGTL